MLSKRFTNQVILIIIALVICQQNQLIARDVEKATFAGGCFWCIEAVFDNIPGVTEVISGYTGGIKENPTYQEVTAGSTGHLEAIQITYDPKKVEYSKLLSIFWRQIDPTDTGGQFVDRGSQYLTAVFYHNDEQKKLAEKSKSKLEKSRRFNKPIATVIKKAIRFYDAEEYHQEFYKKSPERFNAYKTGSCRVQNLESIWGREEDSKEDV